MAHHHEAYASDLLIKQVEGCDNRNEMVNLEVPQAAKEAVNS